MAKSAARIRRSTTRGTGEIGSLLSDLAGASAALRARLYDQATTKGLIGGGKDARISGRVPGDLIEAAKKRAHLSSDTDLIEYALMMVALQDDFGARLVHRKGSIATDIDL